MALHHKFMSTRSLVFVLGRFPPPNDGQSVLTEQVARLLECSRNVERVSTSFCDESHLDTSGRWHSGKAMHYLKLLKHTRRAFATAPTAPIIWAAISPRPMGHLRDLLTILPAFQSGQKVYAVSHWGDFDRLFRSPLTRLSAAILVRRLSGFVFLDGLDKNCEAWIPADKRFTIPNTIDAATRCTDEEIAEKHARRKNQRPLRVLYLSNMIASKGYFDVLVALKLMHTDGFPVHADFVGRWQSEEDETTFKKYVAEHGLENLVTAHGGVADRNQIKKFYLDADVFVLPTYYPTEAQPVSILEAINSGTPVITTRHAGIPNMVREDAQEAIFVPPRSPESIAESFRILSNTDRWFVFSKAAIRRFRNHFSPEAVREKWEALLALQ